MFVHPCASAAVSADAILLRGTFEGAGANIAPSVLACFVESTRTLEASV